MSGFSTKKDRHWTAFQAKNLIQYLGPPMLEAGFHLGLTGSVLFYGESDKDVDVIIYPRCAPSGTTPDWQKARDVLRTCGLRRYFSADEVWAKRPKGNTDRKLVEIWDFEGKRVDFFFMA